MTCLKPSSGTALQPDNSLQVRASSPTGVPGATPSCYRFLGHTEVDDDDTSHLLTEDLQRPHQGLSILNRLR